MYSEVITQQNREGSNRSHNEILIVCVNRQGALVLCFPSKCLQKYIAVTAIHITHGKCSNRLTKCQSRIQ